MWKLASSVSVESEEEDPSSSRLARSGDPMPVGKIHAKNKIIR